MDELRKILKQFKEAGAEISKEYERVRSLEKLDILEAQRLVWLKAADIVRSHEECPVMPCDKPLSQWFANRARMDSIVEPQEISQRGLSGGER